MFASRSGWFIGLSTSSVIGQSDYFGFGFMTRNIYMYISNHSIGEKSKQVHARLNSQFNLLNVLSE